jgi:hypothetical protein
MELAAAVKPKVTKAEDKRAGWAVAIFATVAALLSGVGIGTGDVGHVLSNETGPAIATFALVTLASLLGVIAGWFTEKPTLEHWLIRGSAILLAPAVGTALWTGIAFARERPEPTITAGISGTSGHSKLRFEVKDSGLRSKDSMIVKVRALTEVGPSSKTAVPLYSAALGPGSDGSVDHVGEVPIPPAPASDIEVQAWVNSPQTCYKKKVVASTGCTTVHLTRLIERPQLTISWRNPRHGGAGLFIAVTARDIAQHRAVLRVVDANRHRAVLVAIWPASATGNVSKAITAIIPRSIKKLCVAASTTEPRPDCSAHPKGEDASVLTRTPPR